MMYQKIIVPIDHGNRNMKTEHKIFTSGFVEGDCRPALGEYLQYNGRYYALTEQRIPYMRDKTLDDRFFILTLFAVAMEAEKQMLNAKDTLLQAALPVGLPPKHYGALYRKFEDYFKNRGIQQFTYKGIPYQVEIVEATAFPQDYAAAMTVYQRIAEFNKVITVDIGGFTLDYLMIREGKPDLSVCDSLEKGVIRLYNDISSRVNSEQDILIDDTDIDRIIRGEKTDFVEDVIRIVEDMTRTFVNDILGTLRERGLDLKAGCVVFIGGGACCLENIWSSPARLAAAFLWKTSAPTQKGMVCSTRSRRRADNRMGKKNPFVTTVGFNRHDPAHVEVAQFLNGMERGKAQYIVDAVMAYQRGEQAGVPVLSETERMADYETIRKIVLQVMEEWENGTYGSNVAAAGAMETAEQTGTSSENGLTGLDDNALGGILQSLEVFRG